ncbi:hypothetical protein SAMN05518672_109115 [Chitinophaga sp. CF118]|nr:hypothetical protein SAMN05518672_109115 [Chitinophaga sp. CF118]
MYLRPCNIILTVLFEFNVNYKQLSTLNSTPAITDLSDLAAPVE